MKKLKLIKLLETFSKEEMKQFEKFITSSYFNHGRNFVPIYKILKKYHPHFNSPFISEKNIFKKLYPEKSYDKRSSVSLRVLISLLTAMAEKFIVYETFEKKDKYIVLKNLGLELNQRGLFNHALRVANKSEAYLDKTEKNLYFFQELMFLNDLAYTIYANKDDQPKAVEQIIHNPVYYFAQFFERLSMILNSRQKLGNSDSTGKDTKCLIGNMLNGFDNVLFSDICEYDKYGSKSFVLMHYYLCKMYIHDENFEHFRNCLNFFYENFESFSTNYKFNLFTKLHNIGYFNAHNADYDLYGNAIHKLSEFVLGKGIYSVIGKGHLRAIAYEYIFNFKFAFCEASALKKFIEEYSLKVHPEMKESVKNYSYAFYYFRMQEFERSLDLISQISNSDTIQKNILYKLKIASCYELKYFENAEYTIDAYEHFLRNNRSVKETLKAAGLKFTDSVKFLIKLRTDSQRNYGYDFERIINDNKNSHFGWWFREKVRKLFN